jgi:hypothetical protein
MYPIRRLSVVAVLAAMAALAAPAEAVILARTSTRNTGAPSGSNLNSGWQWEGNFGAFLGTPIASRYFITAEHIGGGVGQSFTLNGKTYTTTNQYDDPSTDLRIFKVNTSFPSYAPIYTGTTEAGKKSLVFGRGTQRGSAVVKGTTTKGWKWGLSDGKKSWGENNIEGTYNGGTGRGILLRSDFDRTGGYWNESALSTGDSGGGVFIYDAGKWKLAGINYLVEGPFSLTGANGSGFNASITDKGGLYLGGDGGWRYNTDTATDQPGNWYSTRISSRQSWIRSIIGTTTAAAAASPAVVSSVTTAVPEPASLSVLAIGGIALLRRRRRA